MDKGKVNVYFFGSDVPAIQTLLPMIRYQLEVVFGSNFTLTAYKVGSLTLQKQEWFQISEADQVHHSRMTDFLRFLEVSGPVTISTEKPLLAEDIEVVEVKPKE